MSIGNDEKTEAVVVFVSGAIIGAALTLLLVRAQRRHLVDWRTHYDDYDYEGGDLFI